MAGKGGGGDQTVTQVLDPATQRFVEQQLRPGAIEAARLAREGDFFTGPTAGQRRALAGFGDIQGAADPRLQALIGFGQGAAANLGMPFDPTSIGQFFDPFQEQVIGGLQSDFDRQRQLARSRAAQQATAAGAFGGSRGEIADILGQQEVGRQEAQTLANVRSGGFQQAVQNALGLFGQGQQAAIAGGQLGLAGLQQGAGIDLARQQGLFGAESALQQLEQQRRLGPLFGQQQALNFLNLGLGPTGFTQETAGPGVNPLLAGLGGAGTGFAIGGPIGGAVGGGLGLLGGLLG